MENICNSKNILAKKRNVAKNFGLTPLGVGGGIACSRGEKFPPPLHTYDLNVRRMFSVDENFEKKMHFQIQIYIYLIIRHPDGKIFAWRVYRHHRRHVFFLLNKGQNFSGTFGAREYLIIY